MVAQQTIHFRNLALGVPLLASRSAEFWNLDVHKV